MLDESEASREENRTTKNTGTVAVRRRRITCSHAERAKMNCGKRGTNTKRRNLVRDLALTVTCFAWPC